MKCKRCGKEFPGSIIHRQKDYDRGDGVMYGRVSYINAPICPFCGHNNTVVVRMRSI